MTAIDKRQFISKQAFYAKLLPILK